MFIYSIRNTVNGKCYIGCTVQKLAARLAYHHRVARGHHGTKYAIHHAIAKYGIDSFEISCVESLTPTGDRQADLDRLRVREAYWVSRYDSLHNGYNETSGGEEGKIFSPETIERMRAAAQKRWEDPTARVAAAEKQRGKKYSEASKAKMAERAKGNQNKKGKSESDETRAKKSKAQTGLKKPWVAEAMKKKWAERRQLSTEKSMS